MARSLPSAAGAGRTPLRLVLGVILTSMSPSATSPEEPAPDGAAEAGAAGREPTARAVRRERFRTILGALTVLACLAVAVFYGLSAPDPDLHPGARGVALRWGVPALWVLLAVKIGRAHV